MGPLGERVELLHQRFGVLMCLFLTRQNICSACEHDADDEHRTALWTQAKRRVYVLKSRFCGPGNRRTAYSINRFAAATI